MVHKRTINNRKINNATTIWFFTMSVGRLWLFVSFVASVYGIQMKTENSRRESQPSYSPQPRKNRKKNLIIPSKNNFIFSLLSRWIIVGFSTMNSDNYIFSLFLCNDRFSFFLHLFNVYRDIDTSKMNEQFECLVNENLFAETKINLCKKVAFLYFLQRKLWNIYTSCFGLKNRRMQINPFLYFCLYLVVYGLFWKNKITIYLPTIMVTFVLFYRSRISSRGYLSGPVYTI